MWLTDVSIRRPVFITMVVLALIVLGLYSRSRMPAELTPKIDLPYISIVTVYPGAGPQEIETLVTKPIEDAVGSTSNLKNITSSSQDGLSVVFMEFEMGTDVDVAAADVRDKLAAAKGNLPDDAKDPIVTKADITAQPIVTLALRGTMSGRELRDYADHTLKDRLSKVSGVASVSVGGGEVREISVAVDRDRLQAYGITIDQLAAMLQAENLNLPSGSIKEGELGAALRDYAVRAVGEFKNAEEIENLQLSIPGAGTIRLGDIAEVKDTVQEASTITRLNGENTVVLAVQKQSNANTIAVADGIKKEVMALNGEKQGWKWKLDWKPFFIHREETIVPNGKPQLPNGVKLITITDDSTYVRDSLNEVNSSLIEGIILVVLIVFLFLHSGRATLIVACAIPTSLIATYLPMWAFGFSLNMMTLLALALCVGILVDDSIVVLENIERHVRKGEPPRQAALTGRSEIGLAAITITLVDVVVFVPIAFMSGIVGQFFRSFGITVATATLFSLFMSFTLTPMLASRWLKSKEQEDMDAAGAQTFIKRLFANFEGFYSSLDRRYRGVLEWALENRALVLSIGTTTLLGLFGMVQQTPMPAKLAIAAIIVAYPLLSTIASPRRAAIALGAPLPIAAVLIVLLAILGIRGTPMTAAMGLAGIALAAAFIGSLVLAIFGRATKGRRVALIYVTVMVIMVMLLKFPLGGDFMPSSDRGQLSVTIELPAGSGLDATDKVARQVEEILSQVRGMEYYQTTIGSTSAGSILGGGETGSQYAHISVKLKDRGPERPESIDEVVTQLTEQTAPIPGAKITVQNLGRVGRGGSPIQMEITGTNMDEIVRVAREVEQRIQKVPGAINVDNSWKVGKPELQVSIDRVRAADRGLTVAQVASALRTSIEGNTNAKLRESGNEYDIRVRLAKVDRSDIGDISNVIVAHSNGSPVYLRDVADIKLAAAPNVIQRKNKQRLVIVSADNAPGPGNDLSSVQSRVNNAIKDVDLGSTTISVGGTSQMSQESNANILSALILAVALVYMLMGALFESFFTPFVIMFSLPQALIGALFALMITGKTLSIISMIGVIMLVGLVTKNAILLVDYTNTLRSRGLRRDDALKEAGPTRLRPILMTTFAMIGGMLPTALALSKGSEWRAPMAIAVIGGLILSTMLTLLVIPTTYSVMDDIVNWIMKKVFRREETTA